jgi:hypothetical protein
MDHMIRIDLDSEEARVWAAKLIEAAAKADVAGIAALECRPDGFNDRDSLDLSGSPIVFKVRPTRKRALRNEDDAPPVDDSAFPHRNLG